MTSTGSNRSVEPQRTYGPLCRLCHSTHFSIAISWSSPLCQQLCWKNACLKNSKLPAKWSRIQLDRGFSFGMGQRSPYWWAEQCQQVHRCIATSNKWLTSSNKCLAIRIKLTSSFSFQDSSCETDATELDIQLHILVYPVSSRTPYIAASFFDKKIVLRSGCLGFFGRTYIALRCFEILFFLGVGRDSRKGRR